MELLAKAMLAIILQYVSLLNQHIVYFKVAQYYRSIISQKSWKNNKVNESGPHLSFETHFPTSDRSKFYMIQFYLF